MHLNELVLMGVLMEMQTAGASVGMIAGAVIAGVAAMLVALALFTTCRRRRSTHGHIHLDAKGKRHRVSG